MEDYKVFEIREGIIFLIEVSDSIFEPIQELGYRSQFNELMSSINELLSELIITSHTTGIGIYLYNCKNTSKNFKTDSGICQLFSLNDINSKNMKLLQDYIDNEHTGIKSFKDLFPANEVPIDGLPIVLNSMLTKFNSKPHYNNKKLVWVTTNDNPYNDDNTRRRLWKIINDYEEYKIFISPLFLNKFESGVPKEFNLEKFQNIFLNSGGINPESIELNSSNNIKTEYDSQLQLKEAEDENEIDLLNKYIRDQVTKAKVNRTTLSTKIKSIILRLREIKRIQFSCNLILSDGAEVGANFGCSIKGYSMYIHEKPKRYESLYNQGEVSKIVQVRTKYVNEDTQDYVSRKPTAAPTVSGTQASGTQKAATEEPQTTWVKGYPIGDKDVLYLNDKQLHYLKNYYFDHTPDGDTNVEDEAGESREIDDVDPPSIVGLSETPYLKLLGFRKVSHFKPHFNTSNPIFVTLDLHNGLQNSNSTGGYQNSFTTFSSLYQSCVLLKRYAVLFGCIKKNSIPSLYALYPTRIENSSKFFGEKPDENEFPQGFFLLRLPWADDIRSIPEYALRENSECVQTDSKVQDSVFQGLVSQYKLIFNEFGLLNYQPSDFPNPTLNYFYKILRTHLLQIEEEGAANDEEEDADVQNGKILIKNDATIGKLIDLHNYIYAVDGKEPRGLLLKNLNSSLNSLVNSEINSKKDTDGNDSKRSKKEVVLTDKDVITAWKNDSWSFFNVSQLRGFISSHRKIAKATRRADMIENIKIFLEEKHGKHDVF